MLALECRLRFDLCFERCGDSEQAAVFTALANDLQAERQTISIHAAGNADRWVCSQSDAISRGKPMEIGARLNAIDNGRRERLLGEGRRAGDWAQQHVKSIHIVKETAVQRAVRGLRHSHVFEIERQRLLKVLDQIRAEQITMLTLVLHMASDEL
jgi:hypothetical protein